MKADLIIYNANIVREDQVITGYMAIKDGKIIYIAKEKPDMDSMEIINAEGKVILPGAIDTHPHFFDPGAEWREDFKNGTRAAASGGFTTILDMPNTIPPVKDRETFELKKKRAKDNSLIDYAFWGSAMPSNLDQIKELHELGCVAFKAFTLEAGPDFDKSDEYDQLKAMKLINEFKGIYGAHAENETLVNRFTQEHISDKWSLRVHDQSRPWEAELTAIHTLLLYAELTGCKLHICHLSIPEGAELIKRAKERKVDVTVETCSHYLTLNNEVNEDLKTYAMINPPLRSKDRMTRLWDYVLSGDIDYLGTDHAPYLEEEKEPKDGNLRNAACGAPEIDVAIPLLLEEGVLNRGMSYINFAKFISTNAAKRFGIYPQKGTLQKGADADFMIVDMDCHWTYTRKKTFSKTKITKFAHEGRQLKCKILATYLRGTAIYKEGAILKEGGFGQFITPVKDR